MSDEFDYDQYEYEYNASNQMEEEDDTAIEIENMFNKAEDQMRSDPNEAVENFKRVIEKEKDMQPENQKRSFPSLKYSIILLLKLGGTLEELPDYIEQLIKLMKYQYISEGNEALKAVVEALLAVKGNQNIGAILKKLLKDLKNMNQIYLYSIACLKLCKDYSDRMDNVESLLDDQTINDQERKNTFLIEISAYKIILYTLTNQPHQIKAIYRQLNNLNYNLQDPRIVGVLNQTMGQQKALERQYESSRKYLIEAFYNYQDAGHSNVKEALKQAVVVSILENFKMNIFDDMRSKAYDTDEDIQPFKILRIAYETQNIQVFCDIINSKTFSEDSFLIQLKPYLQKIMVECKIVRMAKCYSRIKLKYLQEQLLLDQPTLMKYIQGLITKNTLNALIDEVQGFLEMQPSKCEQVTALKVMVDQAVMSGI